MDGKDHDNAGERGGSGNTQIVKLGKVQLGNWEFFFNI